MHLQMKMEYIQDLHNNIIRRVVNWNHTQSGKSMKMKMSLENYLTIYVRRVGFFLFSLFAWFFIFSMFCPVLYSQQKSLSYKNNFNWKFSGTCILQLLLQWAINFFNFFIKTWKVNSNYIQINYLEEIKDIKP